MQGPMGRGERNASTFASNGQRIYYTATSDSGEPITATGGPHWFSMHGGSCVDCHGPRGTGGPVPMTNETAPDIRYSVLTSAHQMDGHEEHPPYTTALIKRAITDGVDPGGHPLSETMPRWHMSTSDLNDLVGYLQTLDGS